MFTELNINKQNSQKPCFVINSKVIVVAKLHNNHNLCFS